MLPVLSQVLFVCIGKYNLNDLFKDAYQPLLLCTEGMTTVIQQQEEGDHCNSDLSPGPWV